MDRVIAILMTILMISKVNAMGWDSDYIEWEQPNGIKFTARWYGDEFEWWMETNDEFRIILNLTDGYYYYAVLDTDGEYTPSGKKVAIDSPLQESYKLDRSASRQAVIDAEREAFNTQLELISQEFTTRQSIARASNRNVSLNMAVLLVEFSDFYHYTSDPEGP